MEPRELKAYLYAIKVKILEDLSKSTLVLKDSNTDTQLIKLSEIKTILNKHL